MNRIMQDLQEALGGIVNKYEDGAFQRGCERGRFEERSDLRPKLDRLKKVEKLIARAAKFVTEQERLNHASDCPGRRGDIVCYCTAGHERMDAFFDIMGDLNSAVDEIIKAAAKEKELAEMKCVCRYSLACQACGTTGP